MKHIGRKLVVALVLITLLMVPVSMILIHLSVASLRSEAARRNYDRLSDFKNLLDSFDVQDQQLGEDMLDKMEAILDMDVIVLKQYVENDVYQGPLTFEGDCVVTVQNGKPVYPEPAYEEQIPLPDYFPEDSSGYIVLNPVDAEKPSDLIFYKQLAGDTYAVRKFGGEERETYQNEFTDIGSSTIAMEQIFDVALAAMDMDGLKRNENAKKYFPEGRSLESLGLTENPAGVREIEKDGELWDYTYLDIPDWEWKIIFLYPQKPIRQTAFRSVMLAVVLMAVFAITLLTWHISCQHMVRDKILLREQFRRYHPSKIRRLTFLFCVTAAFVIFLITFFYGRISAMQAESSSALKALNSISTRLEDNERRNQELKDQETQTVLEFARHAAERIGQHPGLQTEEHLREFAEILGCDYLMLFDAGGKEIVCDRGYTGFRISEGREDGMGEFRRLLRGVEAWILPEQEDEITGETLRKIGVRVPLGEENHYGALILAMQPGVMNREDLRNDTETILNLITPREAVCFSVNRETGKISHSSDKGLIGSLASDNGISSAKLRDANVCGITSYGETWYGASRVQGDDVWFYCVNMKTLRPGNFRFSVLVAAISLVFLGLVSIFLLWDYTGKNYDHYSTVGYQIVRGRRVEMVTTDGRIKETVDPTRRWGTFYYHWQEMNPQEKARMVFQLSILLAVAVALILMNQRGIVQNSMISFIFSGQWDRGANIFALTATAGLIGGAILFLMLGRLIVWAACMSLGTKGETVLRLVFNVLQYVILFIVLNISFNNFGINTAALLGAMAFLSLAVSLGAKDIIADVLSGFTIVFEGEYQVGDIVDIGGYRGKVMEIGARSTKLMGQGDNVKIINNRDVKNVLNMTLYNSWYAIQLTLPSNYPLEEVEAMLKEELPAIGKRMEKIVSGPFYRGVEYIDQNAVRLTILAECREEDYRSVQRQLNREIRLMLERKSLPVK